MPNMKSAIKKVKSNAVKAKSNNDFVATMKTSIKETDKAIIAKDKTAATNALTKLIKKLDKAAQKGAVSKNYVARNKSRLTKKVNELE